jgi:outer membrane protein assembly factor BamB
MHVDLAGVDLAGADLAGGGNDASVPSGEWVTFQHDPQHTGASSETTIGKNNAAALKPLWTVATGGVIAASPSVSGGTVYLGSWDGNLYALDAATGKPKWMTALGTTTIQPSCNAPYPSKMGITSSATVDGNTVYVGGGDLFFYALDAATGKILWKVSTIPKGQQADGYYNYSSPIIVGGSAYVGLSSGGNCPSTVGGAMRIDLTQHTVAAEWHAVPDGQQGGAVWSSPAADPDGQTIYVGTGSDDSGDYLTQPYTFALVALDATTLAVKNSFQVPQSDFVDDEDFGASPTVFDDTNGKKLVGDVSKNGWFYALDRTTMKLAWKVHLDGGGGNPPGGEGSISSAAFANGTIFVGAGNSTVNGMDFEGALTAIDATTGKVKWAHGAPGILMGPISWANGLVFYGTGSSNGGEQPMLEVLDAATGNPLLSVAPGAAAPANFISGGVSIAGGRLFFGHGNGTIYAYGP